MSSDMDRDCHLPCDSAAQEAWAGRAREEEVFMEIVWPVVLPGLGLHRVLFGLSFANEPSI